MTGLTASTTYHFRVVATSAAGTTYGVDRSFSTTEAPGGTASRLSGMAVTEPFNGSSGSLANFSAKWSKLGWAGPFKGEDTTTGWHPNFAFPSISGAYFAPSITDTGSGIASVATLTAHPGGTEQYFSLWLDMSSPSGGTRAGYELRFNYLTPTTYKVTLSKWQGGTQTVLASEASYSFGYGTSLALLDQGSTVSFWANKGSGFSQILSASDSTYGSGNAGVEGTGSTRLTNFKVGALLTPVTGMNAALNELTLTDSLMRAEIPFSMDGGLGDAELGQRDLRP